MALTKLNNNSLHAITDGSALKNVTGTVLQVVSNKSKTTPSAMTSSTFTATGVKVAITPTSASSKILISYTSSMNVQGATAWVDVTLYRDGSTNLAITDGTNADSFNGLYNQGSTDTHVPTVGCLVDTPATTSEVEYEIYFRSRNNSTQVRFNPDQFTNSITAMEIAG